MLSLARLLGVSFQGSTRDFCTRDLSPFRSFALVSTQPPLVPPFNPGKSALVQPALYSLPLGVTFYLTDTIFNEKFVLMESKNKTQ